MKFILAALTAVPLAACLHVHVHEAPRQSTASSVAGTWKARGHDGVPWSAQLFLDDESNQGFFDWRSETGYSGRELVTWQYDAGTSMLFLTGYKLLHSKGNIGVGTYQAQVAEGGQRLVNGTWGPPAMPGTWEAER